MGGGGRDNFSTSFARARIHKDIILIYKNVVVSVRFVFVSKSRIKTAGFISCMNGDGQYI